MDIEIELLVINGECEFGKQKYAPNATHEPQKVLAEHAVEMLASGFASKPAAAPEPEETKTDTGKAGGKTK